MFRKEVATSADGFWVRLWLPVLCDIEAVCFLTGSPLFVEKTVSLPAADDEVRDALSAGFRCSSNRGRLFGRSTGFGVANRSMDVSRSISWVRLVGAESLGVLTSKDGAGLSLTSRRANPTAVSLGLPSAASSDSSFLCRLLISLFYTHSKVECRTLGGVQAGC